MLTARMLEHLAGAAEDMDGLVLDVGANLGSYVLPLAKVYTGLDFVCFEPQQPVFEQLLRNVRENELTNVVAHALALAEAAGSCRAVLPDYDKERNIGAFSLDPQVLENDYEVRTTGQTQQVELRTLDSFDYDRVRMLKVDVEGMELSVLKGAARTLERSGFPPILFEAWRWKSWYSQRRLELIAWIESWGYQVHSLGAFANLAQHPNYARVLPMTELVAGS